MYRSGSRQTVHTVYDEAGHWLGDYDAAGNAVQQAIWLDDLPVGLLVGAGTSQTLYYLEPDALGSPRVAIDPARDVAVWRWDLTGEAFGNSAPNEDPDGDGIAFTLDMRFPGQRYDAASELVYNYFRDYDPTTGRYVESDPIGSGGGISTYSYANSSPFNGLDFFGLAVTLNLLAPHRNPRDDKEDHGSCGATPCGYAYAREYKGNANEFSIAAHGDGNGIWDERLGYKRRVPLDANALAEIIVNHPQYVQTKAIRLLSCRSADGGGFNRSMQHTWSCTGSRSVADEAKEEDPVHRQPEGLDVGSLAAGRAGTSDRRTV